jgi:hypothetical protein
VDKSLESRITAAGTVELSKLHTFLRRNRYAIAGLVALTVIQWAMGLVLHGWVAMLVNGVLTLASLAIGCQAVMRIREIQIYKPHSDKAPRT